MKIKSKLIRKERVSARVDKDTFDKLKKEASKKNVFFSSLINGILKDHVNRSEK